MNLLARPGDAEDRLALRVEGLEVVGDLPTGRRRELAEHRRAHDPLWPSAAILWWSSTALPRRRRRFSISTAIENAIAK